jgi:hypothetical protein
VRDHRQESSRTSHLDRFESLGERADLVQLDQDRVGDAVLDPLPQALGVRHEQIVPDELAAVAKRSRERRPAAPVILREAVLDRHDRILLEPARVQLDHALGAALAGAALLEDIRAVLVQLRRRDVERDRDLLPRRVARRLDRLDDDHQGFLIVLEIRSEATLIADARRQPTFLEHLLQ